MGDNDRDLDSQALTGSKEHLITEGLGEGGVHVHCIEKTGGDGARGGSNRQVHGVIPVDGDREAGYDCEEA